MLFRSRTVKFVFAETIPSPKENYQFANTEYAMHSSIIPCHDLEEFLGAMRVQIGPIQSLTLLTRIYHVIIGRLTKQENILREAKLTVGATRLSTSKRGIGFNIMMAEGREVTGSQDNAVNQEFDIRCHQTTEMNSPYHGFSRFILSSMMICYKTSDVSPACNVLWPQQMPL